MDRLRPALLIAALVVDVGRRLGQRQTGSGESVVAVQSASAVLTMLLRTAAAGGMLSAVYIVCCVCAARCGRYAECCVLCVLCV